MRARAVAAVLCLTLVVGAASVSAAQTGRQARPRKKIKYRGVIRGRILPPGQLAFIGALDHKGKINPKAKMDKPETPFVGTIEENGAFRIERLPYGTYDLVLLTKDARRFEGFHLELSRKFEEVANVADQYEDEDEDPDALDEDEEDMEAPEGESKKGAKKKGKPGISPEMEKLIRKQISKMRTYENKKRAIAMIGNKKRATVLMMLLRDKATTYDGDFGAPVATLRWEIWTWTNWYGGWTKDRDPKLLHRVIMDSRKLRTRAWIWDRALGGVRVKEGEATAPILYTVPKQYTEADGLVPY